MHKKIIVLSILLITSIIILVFLSAVCYKQLALDNKCIDSYLEFAKNNNDKIFSIDKITYFSNCNADISTNYNSSFTISNLYQYTDIAIFINNNSNGEYTASNTLKSVQLSDINFSVKPNYGTPNLYYKNINDFAKPDFDPNNIINNSIIFETTSENEIDYSKPILYNNCANPITLTYVNSQIKDSYTLSNDVSNIMHNGSLLKTCNVTLSSIECQINFIVRITNNLDEVYTCPVSLNIPLSTDNASILDGSLTLKDSTDYNFIKEK